MGEVLQIMYKYPSIIFIRSETDNKYRYQIPVKKELSNFAPELHWSS